MRAIHSVLSQTYKPSFVHVFDNCSDDSTFETVGSLASRDSRVKITRNEKNIGAFANFQMALRSVRTPYFAVISDDDVVSPYFHQRAIDAMERNSGAAVCFGDVIHVTDGNRVVKRALDGWRSGIYPPPSGLLEFHRIDRPEWTGAVFRTAAAFRKGHLREKTTLYSDVEFTLRLAGHETIIVDCTPAAVFNISTSHRAPYPFDALRIGASGLAEEIRSWRDIDEHLRGWVAQFYLDQLRRDLVRRYLTYLVADMPVDASACADWAYQACAGTSQFRLMSALQKLPGALFLLKKAVYAKRSLTRAGLPRFDEEYCRAKQVPLGLLEAWRFRD